jgi:WD40 repeat protein
VLGRQDTPVSALAVFPDGRWLASGGEDGQLLLRHLALDASAAVVRSPEVLGRQDTPVSALAVFLDGRWLASGGQDGQLLLWDLARVGSGATESAVQETEAATLAPEQSFLRPATAAQEDRVHMQHVFIAYKNEDLDFAENVISRLERAGFTTWTDLKIGAGEEWRTAIDLAVKNALALIVIMTPEAKASEYVTYEWALACGIGIRVIPIMLRPTRLHPRLEALQYLDFTNVKTRPWDRLIEEVRAASDAYSVSIPDSAVHVDRYWIQRAGARVWLAVDHFEVGANGFVAVLDDADQTEVQSDRIEMLTYASQVS